MQLLLGYYSWNTEIFTHDAPWLVDVHEGFRFQLRPLVAELEAKMKFLEKLQILLCES